MDENNEKISGDALNNSNQTNLDGQPATPSAPKLNKGLLFGVIAAVVVIGTVSVYAIFGSSSPAKTVSDAMDAQAAQMKAMTTQMEQDLPFLYSAMDAYEDGAMDINLSLQPIELYGDDSLASVNAMLPLFSLDMNIATDPSAFSVSYGLNMGGAPLVAMDAYLTEEKFVLGVPALVDQFFSIHYATLEDDLKNGVLTQNSALTQDDIDMFKMLGDMYRQYPQMIADTSTNAGMAAFQTDMDAISAIFKTTILTKGSITKGADVAGGTEYIIKVNATDATALSNQVIDYLANDSSCATFFKSYADALVTTVDAAEVDEAIASLKEELVLSDTTYTMVIKNNKITSSTLTSALGTVDLVDFTVTTTTTDNQSNCLLELAPRDKSGLFKINMDSTVEGKAYTTDIAFSFEDSSSDPVSMSLNIMADGAKTTENYVVSATVNLVDIMLDMRIPTTYSVVDKVITASVPEGELSMSTYGDKMGLKFGMEMTTKPVESTIVIPESTNILTMSEADLDEVIAEYQTAFYTLLFSVLGMGM